MIKLCQVKKLKTWISLINSTNWKMCLQMHCQERLYRNEVARDVQEKIILLVNALKCSFSILFAIPSKGCLDKSCSVASSSLYFALPQCVMRKDSPWNKSIILSGIKKPWLSDCVHALFIVAEWKTAGKLTV